MRPVAAARRLPQSVRASSAGMRIVVFSQYYRARDAARQREIDTCLQHNLNHPLLDKVVLFLEEGAPPLPEGTVPCETIRHDARLTYADWLRQVPREKEAIALLLNADIHMAEGLEHLPAVFDRPDSFLALTRYNPRPEGGSSLNDYPHWTQDCWGVRSDAPISAGLLHASGFPLGFPGCDNRIAYVMWSHGFLLKNPGYHVRSVHRHADTGRGYDKTDDRLYGGVTYVHPSLTPQDPSDLEHALWTRASGPTGGLVVNQQAAGAGLHTLLHHDPELVEAFQGQQRFSGLSWSREALGSVHTMPEGTGEGWPSEDTIFLPLAELARGWRTIGLRQPNPIAEACVRLPQGCPAGLTLELLTVDASGTEVSLLAAERLPLAPGGGRTFLPLIPQNGRLHRELRLRLGGTTAPMAHLDNAAGLELVLFGREGAASNKSLRRIAETSSEPRPEASSEGTAAAPASGPQATPARRWRRRQAADDLETLGEVARFGRRFRVLRGPAAEGEGERFVFDDPYWPWVMECPTAALPVDPHDRLALLLWGFAQPRQELRPGQVALQPRHRDDGLFWWPGCGTEADAWQAHGLLPGPQREGSRLHVYLGLPWSSFWHSGRVPHTLLQAHGSRLAALRQAVAGFDLELVVHSVCAHGHWHEQAELFQAAGISTLWLAQRHPDQEHLGNLQLRSWHLCPFGGGAPQTRPLLVVKPPLRRPFLVSFQGSGSGGDAALDAALAALHHNHRWHVELDPAWQGPPPGQPEAWQRHDRILSDSVFRLCPSGAGPLRIWEALAVGAIPVLLGEGPALPEGIDWEAIVLRHPLEQLESLPEQLAALPDAEIEARSALALAAHRQRQAAVCFGAIQRTEPTPPPDPGLPDPRRPTVEVPLHGPRDRWFWRSRKCAFHDIVLEWYQRGWINLRFSEGSYFWWGRQGEVLLFERDLIINLQDGKKNPPRWAGDVPYKHAFFCNQYHLPSARNHILTYWGYAPVLLERLRRRGRRGYERRDIGSLFAGSVENETQEYFRNRFSDWGECIEVYACADKLNCGESSPYRLPDYMDLVMRSRFGVSFHGNGPKCYREIEYLALGTPMILTAGLETDYPEPLQEGVHYRLARCREDVPRIVRETGPEEWERMSRACWEWFERNGTIERLFETLRSTIAGLDLDAPRHRRVRIRSGRLAGADCRAARSLAIVDPDAQVLFDDDPGDCPLELAADDLVIAELPMVGQEGDRGWRVEPQELQATCARLRSSAHPLHRQLLALVGVRLPHYAVRIEGPQGEIDPFERLVDGAITLRSGAETAELRAEYDWTRRCTMKYPERVRRIRGPARLEQPQVTAVMRYLAEGREHHADLGPHFTDWYVAHGRLIEPQELVPALKLWEYEGCRLLAIRGRLRDGERSQDFEYVLDSP
ncbi:MAG: exostosin family protein [Synechococcaceae cyanobacterium]|nr:exostosin family protein [Synechococcaceae cyanobacterium]